MCITFKFSLLLTSPLFSIKFVIQSFSQYRNLRHPIQEKDLLVRLIIRFLEHNKQFLPVIPAGTCRRSVQVPQSLYY